MTSVIIVYVPPYKELLLNEICYNYKCDLVILKKAWLVTSFRLVSIGTLLECYLSTDIKATYIV
jgi:hypothetical protein